MNLFSAVDHLLTSGLWAFVVFADVTWFGFFFLSFFVPFFSLCCHPASPQISFTLPSSDWAVVLGLASGSCPGCHHVLMRKGPYGLGPCWWWFMSSSLFSITGLKMEQVCLIQSVKSNWKKERHICCENSCAGERRDCCNSQLKNCVALRRATVF